MRLYSSHISSIFSFFFIIFAAINILSIDATAQSLTPSQTIEIYARADYEGIRLTSGNYLSRITTKLLSLYGTDDVDEPGYDMVFVINGYKIINETIDGDTAFVTIQYDIICDISAYESIFNTRKEELSVRLVKINNEWRLKYPIVPPRVSLAEGIKDTRRGMIMYQNATDPDDKKSYQQLVEAVKRLEGLQRQENMTK